MPKRSNEFQKLVLLVKNHTAAGATVTESKLLQDRITGANREVDVCLESKVGGHEVIISIECRDRKRRADMSWVEEMKAKHERLPTSELVLISRSGFTKRAAELARKYGIKTFALKDLNEDSIEKLFGSCGSLWAKTFSLSPTKVVIGVIETGDLPEENVVALPDNNIFSIEGEEICSAKELVHSLLHLDYVGKEFGQMGDESHKGFEVRWDWPKDKSGKPFCLQKLEPEVLRPIRFVHVTGTCNFKVSEFRLKSGEIGGVRVDWGTGLFFGKPALLVGTKDQSGEKRLSISTEDITVTKSD
jgi:hypothetical protein